MTAFLAWLKKRASPIAWVLLGGALGALLRVGVDAIWLLCQPSGFTFALLLVNIVGAFTTFSAMAIAAFELWFEAHYLAVILFLWGQLVLGLMACYLALNLVAWFAESRP